MATKKGMTNNLITISPDLAKKWLAMNHPNNRGVVISRVRQYADDMQNGRWRITHQGIAFDEKGRLVDGQHRLLAVIQADTSVNMYVASGLDEASIFAIDGGRSRNLPNILEITGALPKNVAARYLVSRATIVHRILHNDIRGAQLNKAQFDALWDVYGDDMLWADEHIKGSYGSGVLDRKIRSAPVVGAIIIAHKVMPEKVAAFSEQLLSGLGTDKDDPPISLRRHLDAIASMKVAGMSAPYATLRSIYAALHNKKIGVYRTSMLTRESPEFRTMLEYFGVIAPEKKS